MDLSVVIPLKDEQANVPLLHSALCAALDPLALVYEIVFVDDGSIDGTFAELSRLAAVDARVRVISLRRNYGQTPALRAGIDAATGAVIVTLDGDLQNDPADIPRLLTKLNEGYDVVLGWREKRQDAFFHRKLPSMLAGALIRWVTKTEVKDLGCTLRAMKREAAAELSLYGEMHRFMSVLALQNGQRLCQMPVRHHPRRFGKTKYNLGRTVRVLLDLITVKFLDTYLTRPMHAFGLAGLACIALGMLSLGATVFQRLVFDERMNRNPLLLLSVMLTLIGVQFISMGLIGEMVARTYFESQGKPAYQVRARLNFDREPCRAKAA
jgi:glycosyltransferase involved in cell wall biosynthesis